jgi:hypothetical protein
MADTTLTVHMEWLEDGTLAARLGNGRLLALYRVSEAGELEESHDGGSTWVEVK